MATKKPKKRKTQRLVAGKDVRIVHRGAKRMNGHPPEVIAGAPVRPPFERKEMAEAVSHARAAVPMPAEPTLDRYERALEAAGEPTAPRDYPLPEVDPLSEAQSDFWNWVAAATIIGLVITAGALAYWR